MDVSLLFGEVGLARFVNEYLHRLPFALPGAAAGLAPLGNWDTVERLLASPDADVMVVRQGKRREDARPTDAAAARSLTGDGYTLLVRHAERHLSDLAELAAQFTNTFRGATDVHLYVTPPDQHGFSWHYDAEDVFILQTTGRKQYQLRKNTVNPWPLVETLPADMQYERELMPLMRVDLQAGDLLYIPCGYWHRAESRGEGDAISLAVGVLSPSALDLFDAVRTRLLDSLVWRQRLPLPGFASEAEDEDFEARRQQLVGQLAAELDRALRDPRLLEQVLSQPPGSTPSPANPPDSPKNDSL